MLISYMRVSSDSDRQSTDLQRDALLAAGVDSRHLFEDRASGVKDNRPGLAKALAFVQPGDVLVVWKLDRLGRSLSNLIEIFNTLKKEGVALRSLTDGMSKSAVCRTFGVKRSTLIDALKRVDWPELSVTNASNSQ